MEEQDYEFTGACAVTSLLAQPPKPDAITNVFYFLPFLKALH